MQRAWGLGLGAWGLHRGVDKGNGLFGFRKPSLLGPLVLKPREAVKIPGGGRQSTLRSPRDRRVPRRFVGRRRLSPESQLQERVRWHVERVARGGRDLRVSPGRGQGLGSQRAMVIGVDQIVRRAWMIGIAREHALSNRASLLPERQRHVPAGQRAKQRERIERLRLIVGRELRSDLGHRAGIRSRPRARVSSAPKQFDCRQEALFARAWNFREPGLWCGSELRQRGPALFGLFEEPQWLTEAQRFTPVGEGEGGVDLLRRPEAVDRIFVREAVQPRDATKKVGLCFRAA